MIMEAFFDLEDIKNRINNDKEYFFSIEERLDIINNSLFKDLRFNKNKVKIM